ncbi:limbic system-associated membrane protein-like [Montipora capricornis]|uniref:limbic system-associated membrane protein-like n=1 Tax=Montipora capricornis TaxID=246305 RepID=UPI0035F14F40
MKIVQSAIIASVTHHLWCVILSSCLTASGIVVSPRNQIVKEGDDAFFNCTQYATNGSDIRGLRYSWSRRNGEAVLSNTSRLNLKNVNRTDAGIYTCTVTNVSANWSDVVNATLHVSYPPAISYWTMNLTVNESSRTSLFCNATGYPPPKIQWNLTDGSSVAISNNLPLHILKISRSQHGRYSCQAHNDAGSSIRFGYLNVQYKPKINRTDLKNTFESRLHRNSTFTCQADGNPSPVVSWSRGLKIAPGSGTSSSSRIFVSPKRDEDFGFYICTARNALGIDEFHMELNRLEPTTNTTTLPPSNELDDIVIVGIAAGGGVFLLVIVFMILLCDSRRRQKRRARPMQPVEFNDPRSHSKDSPRSPNANMYNNEEHKPRPDGNVQLMHTNMSALNQENPEWEYPCEKVHIQKYIGKGAFGAVAKAVVDDLGIVAVKIPKGKTK